MRSFRNIDARPMKITQVIYLPLFFVVLMVWACQSKQARGIVEVKKGFTNNHVTSDWLNALLTRQSKSYLDSLKHIERSLSPSENDWLKLIQSKKLRWNSFRDSLSVPFQDIQLSDTIYVLAGSLGDDDGFTFEHQTICLDVTALNANYGTVDNAENDERIDRIFSHEYTHLLHKAWARKNNLVLKNFKDSILWECLYEGIGMYRSLSKKWTAGDSIPGITRDALNKLYPVFVDRLIQVYQLEHPTNEEKISLNKNLSRGNVDQKWGAFPMAIWLKQEAKGNDRTLINWVNAGPNGAILLALKYLPEPHRSKLKAGISRNSENP